MLPKDVGIRREFRAGRSILSVLREEFRGVPDFGLEFGPPHARAHEHRGRCQIVCFALLLKVGGACCFPNLFILSSLHEKTWFTAFYEHQSRH